MGTCAIAANHIDCSACALLRGCHLGRVGRRVWGGGRRTCACACACRTWGARLACSPAPPKRMQAARRWLGSQACTCMLPRLALGSEGLWSLCNPRTPTHPSGLYPRPVRRRPGLHHPAQRRRRVHHPALRHHHLHHPAQRRHCVVRQQQVRQRQPRHRAHRGPHSTSSNGALAAVALMSSKSTRPGASVPLIVCACVCVCVPGG